MFLAVSSRIQLGFSSYVAQMAELVMIGIKSIDNIANLQRNHHMMSHPV